MCPRSAFVLHVWQWHLNHLWPMVCNTVANDGNHTFRRRRSAIKSPAISSLIARHHPFSALTCIVTQFTPLSSSSPGRCAQKQPAVRQCRACAAPVEPVQALVTVQDLIPPPKQSALHCLASMLALRSSTAQVWSDMEQPASLHYTCFCTSR